MTTPITSDPAELPSDPSSVSIGFFDGVHRGHRAIIERAIARSREDATRCVVVTFDRHPLEIVRPDAVPPLLMTPRRRARTLAGLGVDAVVMLAFDDRRRAQAADAFVDEVVVGALRARHVVVGGNFRFGHRAAGDVALLRTIGARAGFTVDGVELLADDDGPISSTRIRAALAAGDVVTAAALLSRPHVVDGTVVAGDRRGAGLGYPTANLATDPRVLIPAAGVYAGRFDHPDGRRLPAVTSIGTNPTFDGADLRVESHVLDLDEDLYGLRVAVDVRHRVRGQQRFDDVDDLVAAMARDVEHARAMLTHPG